MKTATLQIQNTKGEVLSEETIIIESSDKLVVQVPENTTMDAVRAIYDNVKIVMENANVNVIVIPESVKLSVLKIKE